MRDFDGLSSVSTTLSTRRGLLPGNGFVRSSSASPSVGNPERERDLVDTESDSQDQSPGRGLTASDLAQDGVKAIPLTRDNLRLAGMLSTHTSHIGSGRPMSQMSGTSSAWSASSAQRIEGLRAGVAQMSRRNRRKTLKSFGITKESEDERERFEMGAGLSDSHRERERERERSRSRSRSAARSNRGHN
ncbi:hypothetical protein KIPB_006430 [Kipferlia bialata]|uniref:Uncharacterized protein n=1 Tax=Kipferlia bialata TaxID=797122 RepID=A0A9K3CX88_9EUKA|nr:hypothetical protein KIPB_006430 [Kipferlia bialata]|eukprot:g6430.t1